MITLPIKKISFGDRGERVALNYLRNQGYEILARNYKTRLGEIDIIGQESDIITFIEVKTRSSRSYGLPQESVNFKKQNKIMRMALQYLQEHDLEGVSWRIDVVAVIMDRRTHSVENIELIRNAVMR